MYGWLKNQDREHEERVLRKKLEYEKGMLDYLRNEEEHLEAKILNQKLHEERRQAEYHESIFNEQRRRELLQAEADHEERIAKRIQQQQLEEFRNEKLSQILRRNSPELRELESKLKTAYVTMVRHKQFADKDRIRAQEAAEKIEQGRQIDRQVQEFKEEDEKKDIDTLCRKRDYHQELDRQLEQKEVQRYEAYLQLLCEKMMIDDIVKKVVDEEVEGIQKRLEKRKELQEYITQFRDAQQKYREEEKQRLEQENQNILQYLLVQDLRLKEVEELKQFKMEVRERVKDEIADVLEEQNRNKEYDDDLRVKLAIEEKEASARRSDLERFEQRLRMRLDLQKGEAIELKLKEERLKREKLEEECFREQMMIRLAEEDKLELMNDHKRRMKQIEHKKAIQKMIEEGREKKLRDKQYDMEIYLREQKMEKQRRELVERERQLMLEETATKLLGYLPKNVIRDREDLEKLGEEFKQFYQRKPLYYDENVDI